jgi:SAM-dependent methyltransferase
MGFIGGKLGYYMLRSISPAGESAAGDGTAYRNRSKLETLLGPDVWREIAGKSVIDFGCGTGGEAIELAQRGAAHVTGIDIRESALAEARRSAVEHGVADKCEFVTSTDRLADVIISIDAFEHFDDPGAILEAMARLLKPAGAVLVAFGPPWLHPLGGHLFSVFPWAHLVFTERALIRWRSDFKSDGATRFGEVEGGLNQMTVERFLRIVSRSSLKAERFETVPIRRLRPLHNRLTREFVTAIVRCRLVHR